MIGPQATTPSLTRVRTCSPFPILAAVIIVGACICCEAADPAGAPVKSTAAEVQHPFPRRVAAPELDGGLGWVNTEKPLKLSDLRGKFVLLDFWTYCCINCIHTIPELEKLERAYPNQLVVIGVHSAKFEGEQEIQNIRDAVLRYEIEHPVVNDADMAIWRRYGVRSWPTLVLIDPNGEAVWIASGEQTFDDMREPLEKGIVYYRQQGKLDEKPLHFAKEADNLKPMPLKFPGKILADEASNRLFIADSNHNRIVIATLDGELLDAIGSGVEGLTDGSFEESQFHHPQGMALDRNALYIADTENHVLRQVDLDKRTVKTIAGTGEMGRGSPPEASPTPLETPLASPWALWIHGGQLYIAMAGTHQIWRMPLDASEVVPYAGNGREDIVDGPLLPNIPYQLGFASFAQPSGLTSDGERLYVADSEGSTIRSVPFDPTGKVETLVGITGTLFDFGDIDGIGRDVRLQHALGVTWHDGNLYIADTYNNKIKRLDVKTRNCQTLAGTGKSGIQDAQDPLHATFDEPAGISAAAGKLYISDTNNHSVRIVNLENGKVSTLAINGLSPPKSPGKARP